MQLIQKYFAPLSARQTSQFLQLGPLYGFWNQRINMISRKDIDNLYLHHVLHSLSVAKIIRFNPGSVIIDAGTGGGFPGIPLAIIFPDVQFILVDSVAKKIRVVETIIQETRLGNCEIMNLRLENLKLNADFVVCRAVSGNSETLRLGKEKHTAWRNKQLKKRTACAQGRGTGGGTKTHGTRRQGYST